MSTENYNKNRIYNILIIRSKTILLHKILFFNGNQFKQYLNLRVVVNK